MTFLWPSMLWLLALLPALVVLYLLAVRRRHGEALRYPGLTPATPALHKKQEVRRHLPAILLLCGLAWMILSIARPAATITLPSAHGTVVLAIDVSGSMRAEDVKPNRLAAAQSAARAFVRETPLNTRIGIVTFSNSAALVQRPSSDREAVLSALDSLQPEQATAVGSGLLLSLKALFPDQELDAEGSPLGAGLRTHAVQKHVTPGSYANAAVVLLSDGQNTAGPDPVKAAQLAADRGVRVFTVGVGTSAGEIITGEGWSIRVELDEDALKRIAAITRGEYFFASSATELRAVYETLTERLVLETRQTEVTALFSALAAAMVLLSAGLSLAWFQRIL